MNYIPTKFINRVYTSIITSSLWIQTMFVSQRERDRGAAVIATKNQFIHATVITFPHTQTQTNLLYYSLLANKFNK